MYDRIDHPTAGLWTYFTNDTCRPTTNPADTCTLGHYPALVIMAKTTAHIKAGIDFARNNNLRLIIRNTGHDFLGRSVGWGALVINTHSFQDVSFTNSWSGPGGYKGSAITVGAGVQAIKALQLAHAQKPPKVMVTGECAVRFDMVHSWLPLQDQSLTRNSQTVGVAGGLVQGGGHGPLTTLKGFLADTALEFKVITADGVFRTANANTNSDLFWALRGGGPSAFAVILSATYKTFDDVPSTGINLDINNSHNTNSTLYWQAVSTFHSYANYFVDNGLYVYYEVGPVPNTLHVHPILGIGKTPAELEALVQPLFDDLEALGIGYDTSTSTYPTFFDLYFDMFEVEAAGNSALTGGWTFGKTDVANNHGAIIDSFKNALDNGAFFVGHMWNGGHGLPRSEWSKSAVNPRFRNVSDKVITIVPVSGNDPLSVKAEAQNRLTNVVDGAMKAAGPNGAAYINEADPFLPDWQDAFWGTNYPRLLQLRKKWDPLGVFYSVSTPGTENWTQIEYGTRLCKKV